MAKRGFTEKRGLGLDCTTTQVATIGIITLVCMSNNMFGQNKIDKEILRYYEKMPLKQIANKVKCSQRHVIYVIYEKNRKRR